MANEFSADNPFSLNIAGVGDLIESGTNKVSGSSTGSPEGALSVRMGVLDLDMSDKELLKLKNQWEKQYAPYEGEIKKVFERNLRSYLGRNRNNLLPSEDEVGAANLQFEAEETFLPATFAQNPSPEVYCDNTPDGNKVANEVQTMLQYHADQLLLRRKLEVMVRQWSIYHLGVIKLGWDDKIEDVVVENRKIQNFIFDPHGYVDVYGDFSSWLGERITVTAEKLIELFPDKEDEIKLLISDNDGIAQMGTECVYTEWWTDEYCFSTFKDIILDKHKNEFFNYKEEAEEGEEEASEPYNHFAQPKAPYIFLSIFSLQERPHDITGLIEQNIPNQSKITRRVEQIDSNVSQSNNGIAFSENNFTQETAKQAANALIKQDGGKILVPPGGPISEAIVRISAPSFPEAAFKDLENSENHLRSSWGIQGIVSQPQKSDTTARGMILNQGRDTSRIGGGISDVVEQSVARSIFNWLVQLYAVFYDEKHFAAVIGVGKAVEYVELSSRNINRQLVVTVSPNSMKPKDEVTKMNMAQDLYAKGAIGPKILLESLDFPNPDEAAADGALWQIDKVSYMKLNFPELMQQLEAMQAQQAAQQAQQMQPQGVPSIPRPVSPQANPQPTESASLKLAQLPIPNSPTGL